jgi:hypothetical protein
MANWTRFKTNEICSKISTREFKGSRVLSFLNNEIYEKPEIIVHDENAAVEVNLKRLVSPLGRVGRMLIKNNRIDTVQDIIKTYWLEKGNADPTFVFDVAEVGEEVITLRNKIIFNGKKSLSLSDFFTRIKPEDYKDFDEVVIGGEGEVAEVQFLSTINGRIEARPNDFLDAGIFIHINGNVKVSAGVNRLVCTNGLTNHFNFWNNEEFDFLKGDTIFRQGLDLARWFAAKANQPVENIRAISTAFGHVYPKGILMRKWKEWSEKIELKTLMWFDVINDLTSMANKNLGGIRYKLLEAGLYVQKMEETGCCPVCSANV